MHFLILNGPNLNLLGRREIHIYGSQRFEEYLKELQTKYSEHQIDYFQSNHEGYLIDKLQEVGYQMDGIIFNPAGYTHTSIALHDTVKAIESPVVEVHISNILARESFRHHSYIKNAAVKSIIGEGLKGYDLALAFLLSYKKNKD
jgi:3-dehydroquinate dehydratase-2